MPARPPSSQRVLRRRKNWPLGERNVADLNGTNARERWQLRLTRAVTGSGLPRKWRLSAVGIGSAHERAGLRVLGGIRVD